ncbi:MAG: radical SAM protein [Elusimicrobia bacterium]|nr:radical SAM protein [Elusimicrobiota bacterium]
MKNENANPAIVVYLAELAHDGFGLSLRTFPLGLGVVGSYVKEKFSNRVDLHLFRTYGDLMAAVKEKTPDIVGFGYFSWNDYLTLVAARAIRESCPRALIVFGGANISPFGQEKTSGFPFAGKTGGAIPMAPAPQNEALHSFTWPVYNDYQLLAAYPNIDVLIHGDGEIPMADLVAKFIETGDKEAVKSAGVPGCSSRVGDAIVCGPAPEILFDLDRIPSPYSSGLFKGFMDKYNLLPQIETTRGCPYKCTFCTVGLNEGKMRKHSLEYSKDEIRYLMNHYPNTVLRIADPNWGIAEKDVELAEFIHELRKTTGYPSSLRVYYSAGGPFKNIKTMALLMKDLLPLNMSFQSLNVETLKNIKRGNMPLSKVQEMVAYARSNGIASSTELISGLPKESLSSFKNSFLMAVTLRLDSVYVGALYLIKGSELYTGEARAQYKFRTKFALIEKDVTRIDDRWVFEMDELVVEHSEMTEADFYELYRFKIWGMVGYGSAYLKEIIMHGFNYDVTIIEIYDELVGNPERYPFHRTILSEYVESIKPLFFDTPQALEEKLVQHIEKHGNVDRFYWNRYTQLTMAKVLGRESKVVFVNEVAAAAKKVFDRKVQGEAPADRKSDFYSILDVLSGLQPDCIISPLETNERVVNVELPFDVKVWADENYEFPLSRYRLPKPRRFGLVIRNIQEHINFMRDTKSFDSTADKYEYYYNVMVSSNMRRSIAYAEEHGLINTEVPGVVHPMENN